MRLSPIVFIGFLLCNCQPSKDGSDSEDSQPTGDLAEDYADTNEADDGGGDATTDDGGSDSVDGADNTDSGPGEEDGGDDTAEPPPLDQTSPAGTLILDSSLSGSHAASDLPTILYDVGNDVTTLVEDPDDVALTGTLAIAVGGRPLRAKTLRQTDDALLATVTSNLGGSIGFKGSVSATERVGSLNVTKFVGREGFPMLDSGEISLNLSTSEASITGSVLGKDLLVGANLFTLDAAYDLFSQDGFWRGTMKGTIAAEDGVVAFEYNYDTPILVAIEAVALDGSGNEVDGAVVDGGNVRVKLKANSNAPINWVNTQWDNPSVNLEGGGGGTSYCRLGDCGAPAEWEFQEIKKGYWTWYRDFSISEYQESGTYTWKLSVENASGLSSRTREATIEVVNSMESGPPVIHSASLETDPGLLSGGGGDVTLHLVAESVAPANWVSLSLDGPNANLEGGGGGATFAACADETATAGHPCFGLAGNYQYYTRTWSYGVWAENGTYTFSTLKVQNAADLESANHSPALTFAIAGNAVATTPVINSVTMYYGFSDSSNPAADGIVITDLACLESGAVGMALNLALVFNATSTAPVNWINTTFDGPEANLEGGGGGTTGTDLGGNTWQVIKTNSIDAPEFAPEGIYYWSNMSLANEGEKTSAAWAGDLRFELKGTCP